MISLDDEAVTKSAQHPMARDGQRMDERERNQLPAPTWAAGTAEHGVDSSGTAVVSVLECATERRERGRRRKWRGRRRRWK